jgi:hypothetical protein
MAYPTGLLSFVLEQIDQRILAIKKQAQVLRADALAGPIQSGRILSAHQYLRAERAALVTAGGTPGLAAFARDQKNNQTLDVVAEFNAVIAAIDNVTGWIATNFPKDAATQALLERTLEVDGPVERTFTTVQTAGFRTQLDSLIATIA